MDTRIRIIAEAITKDAESNLKRLAELEKDLQNETNQASDAAKRHNEQLNKSSQSLSGLQTEGNKTTSMFKNLGATMLALFAVDKIIDYTKQVVGLMAETDKLRIALRNVVSTEKDYQDSLVFLSSLSQKYGQNVNILTQAYTNFIASSNSSNLSLKQRQDIYASIIKAGSALKLSNDSIEGSLRAVSQMFSKGNIQAEELRGQLGERLPGAFGIMAKSMGVSEIQLNKMLDQGQVLAEDALPKFAKALEEVYGDKAQSNLKTIGGAWNVLVNNFIEGLQDLNKSSGFIELISGWILSAANGFKTFVGVIKEAFTIGTKYNSVLNKAWDYYEAIWSVVKNVIVSIWDLGKSIGSLIGGIIGVNSASKAMEYWISAVTATIQVLGTGIIGAIALVTGLADTFNALINTGKKVLNFFGGNFKIDTNATFGAVADNFKNNIKRIENVWTDSQKTVIGSHKKTKSEIEKEENKAANQLNNITNGVLENTKNTNKKAESEHNRYLKALEKDKAENTKAIKKILEEADKDLIDSLHKQYKAGVKNNEDEVKALKKTHEEKLDLIAENMKMTASLELMRKIKTAKTLDEIERYEKDYAEQIKKIDLGLLQLRLSNKQKEYTELKELGALTLENEEKYKKEIMELENKMFEFTKKQNEKEVDEKKKNLKEQEDLEEKYQKRKKNTWENILNTSISDTAIASGKIVDIFKSIDIGNFLANNLDEISNLLSKAQEKLDKIIEETTDNTKKANAQLSKEMIKPWEESVNAAKSLLSGDLVGTATGIFGHLKGMWNMTFGLKKTLSDIKHDDFQSWYQSNIDSLNNFQDKIKSTFGDLFTDTIQLSTEIDNSTTGRINAEIKIGEQIKANYEKAVEEENKLYNTKIDNINKEYAYKDMKALQELGIATLNIKQKMNEDLLAFITNEDTKASLQSDYLEKRKIVIAAYADKIKPISEGMSDAEIEGIKAAEKARDEALANVEDWLTTEFQFIFSNEEQKRKEYSETEKIILQGQEDINTLKIKFQADEIERNKQKNIEIETAYEDHMKVLGKLEDDKNVAMLASFNSMKDAMISGLRELEAAANRAYNEGIINLDEYTKRLDDILRIRELLGTPLRTPYKPDNIGGDNTNKYDNYNPQSEQAYVVGTEYVDRENKFPDGIDTVKAKLTKGEAVLTKAVNKKKLDAGLTNIKAIEYAVNFKSMLDNPGFMPLQLKSSILPKLEERAAMQYLLNMNMVPVVDELREVKQALSKIPIQNFTLDENGLNKFVKKGNSVQKLRKKRFE